MKKHFYFIIIVLLLSCSTVFAQNEIKVACVGNSITYGYGIKNRDSLNYPMQLQRMLGRHYVVRNYGVSGRTLLKKGDYPYWKEDAFQEVQNWDPDIIVIMLGTNDTKTWNWKYGDEFAEDYKDFLEVFKNLPGEEQIWAALPVPVFKANPYKIRDSIIHLEIPIIKAVAAKEKVSLMNLYKALKPYGRYFPDGVHPDGKGAYYLAKAVYENLKEKNKE